ncbi:MAG TPA: ThiF family adenylyltransferase [Draconibacterium sp.]|nr:ThiF family adenylyltransferase [Draconibacterium sp.]
METHEWHKHPSFKNLFESEISILKRGLKGDFKLYKLEVPKDIGARVEAFGELKFGTNHKQKVRIIFPTKYPYAAPSIIACNYNVDEKGNITSQIQLTLFGKGNQYTDGKMCLMRTEQWDKEKDNIGSAMRRAQSWLKSATSKEGFKKEEIVEEFPSIMEHVGQVLIPKDIPLQPNINSGNFILTQFKPNNYILESNFLPESTFKLNVGQESFRWYRLDEGITLKTIFPTLTGQDIINLYAKYLSENINEGDNVKKIALYLPSETCKWHFFKVVTQKQGNQILVNPPIYYISRNISQELYLRTKDIFDDKILAKKKVTIVGVGAIGSEVAISLAKNGVGHFNLFDMDKFEIGNSVRHAADLFYIGEHKVNVAKQLILRSNPNLTVNTFNTDVLNDNGLLESSLNNSDLCIVLTAEDSVEYLINDFYQKNYNIPFIFARASMGAFSGAIQVVDSQSACLKCLSLYNADTLPKPISEIRLSELTPEYGSCSSPALPGSEIDTKEIALQVSRVAMQCLLKDEKSTYPELKNKQYYWHGPYGSSEKEPFTWEMKNIEKHKDCPICH